MTNSFYITTQSTSVTYILYIKSQCQFQEMVIILTMWETLWQFHFYLTSTLFYFTFKKMLFVAKEIILTPTEGSRSKICKPFVRGPPSVWTRGCPCIPVSTSLFCCSASPQAHPSCLILTPPGLTQVLLPQSLLCHSTSPTSPIWFIFRKGSYLPIAYSAVSTCAWDRGGVKKAKDTFRVQVLSWRAQDAWNRDGGKTANEGVTTPRGGYPLFTPQLHSCLKEFRGVDEQETEGWGQNEPLGWGKSRKNCPLNKEGPASKVPVQGSREMGQREALPAAWLAVRLVSKQPRVGWGSQQLLFPLWTEAKSSSWLNTPDPELAREVWIGLSWAFQENKVISWYWIVSWTVANTLPLTKLSSGSPEGLRPSLWDFCAHSCLVEL